MLVAAPAASGLHVLRRAQGGPEEGSEAGLQGGALAGVHPVQDSRKDPASRDLDAGKSLLSARSRREADLPPVPDAGIPSHDAPGDEPVDELGGRGVAYAEPPGDVFDPAAVVGGDEAQTLDLGGRERRDVRRAGVPTDRLRRKGPAEGLGQPADQQASRL